MIAPNLVYSLYISGQKPRLCSPIQPFHRTAATHPPLLDLPTSPTIVLRQGSSFLGILPDPPNQCIPSDLSFPCPLLIQEIKLPYLRPSSSTGLARDQRPATFSSLFDPEERSSSMLLLAPMAAGHPRSSNSMPELHQHPLPLARAILAGPAPLPLSFLPPLLLSRSL